MLFLLVRNLNQLYFSFTLVLLELKHILKTFANKQWFLVYIFL